MLQMRNVDLNLSMIEVTTALHGMVMMPASHNVRMVMTPH